MNNLCYSLCLLLALLILLPLPADSAETPIPVFFRDEAGRHLIPRGFVVVTEQGGKLPVDYARQDYQRMVRLGANFQVIRLTLGPLGGWPGNPLLPAYLNKVDRLVTLGREVGFHTCFKLTVYFSKGFNWTALWENQHNEQDFILAAWQRIWERYQGEASVFGYDLLNEPQKGALPDYQTCQNEFLIPLYRRLIDELHQVSPEKWAFYQPLQVNHEDRPDHRIPFIEMQMPIERDHIIYAPHTYEGNPDLIAPILDRYQKDAALSGAPMMMGEWGPWTLELTDHDWERQVKRQRIYLRTTGELDRRGLGGIKAWFTGSLCMCRQPKAGKNFTWALFREPLAVGTAERKYIVDYIARPKPLAIAGTIKGYHFDFATRIFTMHVRPDRKIPDSTIHIGANRHYPDGFSILCDNIRLTSDPLEGGKVKHITSEDAAAFKWNPESQRLTISRWPGNSESIQFRIIPGTTGQMQRIPDK